MHTHMPIAKAYPPGFQKEAVAFVAPLAMLAWRALAAYGAYQSIKDGYGRTKQIAQEFAKGDQKDWKSIGANSAWLAADVLGTLIGGRETIKGLTGFRKALASRQASSAIQRAARHMLGRRGARQVMKAPTVAAQNRALRTALHSKGHSSQAIQEVLGRGSYKGAIDRYKNTVRSPWVRGADRFVNKWMSPERAFFKTRAAKDAASGWTDQMDMAVPMAMRLGGLQDPYYQAKALEMQRNAEAAAASADAVAGTMYGPAQQQYQPQYQYDYPTFQAPISYSQAMRGQIS